MSHVDSDLIVTGLCKEYVTAAGSLTVLKCVDLSLTRGDALAITGPSGSGKSSLLFVLGGLERPTQGAVRLRGRDVFAATETELAAWRQESVGFVFQEHHLLPQCTVLENVLIPRLAGSGTTAEDVSRDEVARTSWIAGASGASSRAVVWWRKAASCCLPCAHQSARVVAR